MENMRRRRPTLLPRTRFTLEFSVFIAYTLFTIYVTNQVRYYKTEQLDPIQKLFPALNKVAHMIVMIGIFTTFGIWNLFWGVTGMNLLRIRSVAMFMSRLLVVNLILCVVLAVDYRQMSAGETENIMNFALKHYHNHDDLSNLMDLIQCKTQLDTVPEKENTCRSGDLQSLGKNDFYYSTLSQPYCQKDDGSYNRKGCFEDAKEYIKERYKNIFFDILLLLIVQGTYLLRALETVNYVQAILNSNEN